MSIALDPSRENPPGSATVPLVTQALATLLLGGRRDAPDGGLAAEQVVDLLPVAVYACDAAGRITFFNRRAAELWGREPALNDDRDVFCACHKVFLPDGTFVPPAATPMARAVREGVAFRGVEATVERLDGSRFEASVAIDPLRDAAGRLCGAINVFQDVTEQKRRERRTALLDELTARLAPIASEAEIIRLTTQLVGEHLRVQRCGFIEADAACDELVVAEGWRPPGVPSIAGRYAVGKLLRPEAWHAIESRSLVVADIATDPLTAGNAANYAHLRLRAFVACPCSQARPRLFVLGLAHDTPRAWAAEDVTFVEHVVARVWPLIERARSEAALRESEARLRLATQSGRVGIWDWDIAANRVSWTDSLYAIHGVKPGEFGGTVESFAALVHPDDRAPVQRALHSALEHNVPYELEFRAVRADGAIVWVFTTAIVVRENGRAARMHGASFDITARKHAELGLRESEKRFRTLASHAPVGIFLTDPHGATLFVNECWTRMTGLSSEEARGEGWMRAIHPADRERVTTGWSEAVNHGGPSMAEYRFLRGDGSVTWVEGNAVQVRDTAGRLTGYIGTIADVTARKLAEEKLRAQEAQLRFITDHAPVSLAHCSRDGRYLFVNRTNAERMGLRVEEIIGRPIAEVMGGEALRTIQPYIDRVLRGEAVSYEAEVPYRTIGPRFIRVSYAPDFAPDGTVQGWLGVITDMTERRAMEQALRQAQTQLQAHAADLEQKVAERTASLREAIAQMEEFSYSVSHDLRAPLRAMNAYAQALTEDYGPQLDDTARDYLARIQRSSQRMEQLTHDVLTYSRLARTEISLERVPLVPLLRDLILQYAELQPAAADVEIMEPLPDVMAHEVSLGQCLANLLTNAAKFVAPGVRPRIRVRATPVAASPARVRVWIEDNGIGIDPRHQERLFRVFERVSGSKTYDGTGIGLAIVRRAMEKMGGACGVESDGRTGSRFWIELAAG